MPHYAVKLRVIVEVEAADEWRAQDVARDLFVAPTVTRFLIAKCEPVLWEGGAAPEPPQTP